MLETKVNSNITIKYIPMSKLKTTTMGVYIHRPLVENEVSQNALLPYVLKRSCKKYPSTEAIAKELEALYGATLSSAVTKFGEDHVLYFDAETISEKYALSGEKLLSQLTELLLNVIFEPDADENGFDSMIFEQEKKNAKDRILASINDKRSYASIRCQQEMCQGDSFALSKLGTIDGMDSITPKSLYAHYKKIISSSPIDIYICGEADIDEIKKLVENYVSGMEFATPKLPQTKILQKDTAKKDVTEEMDVTQGKLSIGFRTNTAPIDGDYAALSVFNSVFGAGAHSKLFNNVREKLSLAYYASSQLEKYKGLLIVNAGIEFENFEKAYTESLSQLEEIKKGNISDLEFTSSIQAITNSYQSFYDDQRYMQSFYLSEHIAGTNRNIDDVIKAIQSVTKEDVKNVAHKLELDTVYFLKGKGNK